MEDVVVVPYTTGLSSLSEKYIAALDGAIGEAKKTGELEIVISIETEKTAFKNKRELPAKDEDSTPASLKKLRGIYRSQLDVLDKARLATLAKYQAAYIDNLKELEKTLTQQDRVGEATEIMVYRKALVKLPPQGPPITSPKPVATSKETSAATPESKPADANLENLFDDKTETLKLGSGNDHKAAVWILEQGGSVVMVDHGRKVTVSTKSQLPPLPAKLVSVSLELGSDRTKVATFDSGELEKLTDLSALEAFSLKTGKILLPTESLKFLATCPKLKIVSISTDSLSSSLVNYLAPLAALAELDLSGVTFNEPLKFSLLKSSSLVELNLGKTRLDDSTLRELSSQTSLEDIVLSENKGMTDAGIIALKGNKKLKRIVVDNTMITIAGLEAFQGCKVVSLTCGCNGASEYARLVKLFPDVTTFILPWPWKKAVNNEILAILAAGMPNLQRLYMVDVQPLEEGCSAYADFKKLKFLSLGNNVLSDATITAVAKNSNIEELILWGTKISDPALAILQEMKNLKMVSLARTHITDAGLSAFKKARPDIKVSK